jgi:uncharacterized protein
MEQINTEELVAMAEERLDKLLSTANIESGHGIEHARAVLNHARAAASEFDLRPEEYTAILLAALLHDADDRKFFKNSHNAEDILENCPKEIRELALEMIKLVSCSKNGNSVYGGPQWMLIPRYSDRLEAMGKIGVERCYSYMVATRRPEYGPDTPRAYSAEEVMQLATPERFMKYQETGNSATTIDHFLDKLLHLLIKTGIAYIDKIMEERHQYMVNYIIEFWKTHQ